MDPRALGLADGVLDDVDEGRGVVARDGLARLDRGDERGVDDRAARAQRRGVRGGDLTPRYQGLDGQELDLEHGVETMLVAEERRDVSGAYLRNHASPSTADFAISLRTTIPSKVTSETAS